MDYLKIALASFGSILVLFVLTKLMGNRQMSQLSMFDYINGITIGSIAAEMATSLESDLLKPLIAMCVYALVTICISLATCKSIQLRRIFTGKPLILLEEGKLYEGNLKKAKFDISEFLTQCRINGYFNIADVQTAVLESNGKISFLPKVTQRPVTPEDLKLNPSQAQLVANVIIDGSIMTENLKYTGNNETWLKNQLHAQGISSAEDVFLATCDSANNLSVYKKRKKCVTRDIFE